MVQKSAKRSTTPPCCLSPVFYTRKSLNENFSKDRLTKLDMLYEWQNHKESYHREDKEIDLLFNQIKQIQKDCTLLVINKRRNFRQQQLIRPFRTQSVKKIQPIGNQKLQRKTFATPTPLKVVVKRSTNHRSTSNFRQQTKPRMISIHQLPQIRQSRRNFQQEIHAKAIKTARLLSNRSSKQNSINHSRDYKSELNKMKTIKKLPKKILTSYISNEKFYKQYENVKSTNSSRASSNRSSKMSTPRKNSRQPRHQRLKEKAVLTKLDRLITKVRKL